MAQERPSGPTFEEVLDDDDVDQGLGAAGGNIDRTQREMMERPIDRTASGPHLSIAGQDAHKNIIVVVCLYK